MIINHAIVNGLAGANTDRYKVDSTGQGLAYGLVAIGAGMAMFGALGAGVGQGVGAGLASNAIGRNPEVESKVRTNMIIGAAIAESSAIYCLIVSILLIFVY